MKLSSLFLAFSLAGFSSTVSALECTLTDPVVIDKDGYVTLQQFLNKDSASMTMKITYTGGRSWIGVGINEAGQQAMTPSTVVMGFGNEDGNTTIPMTYSLTTKAQDGSGVNPAAFQTLQNATFEQTDTTSTLLFSQSIENFGGGSPVTDDSQWIFAIGSPNNGMWHPIKGSFQLALTRCGASETEKDATPSLVIEEIEHPERNLWIAHGILLAVAWGFCSPVAIGASILRSGFDQFGFPKGSWYKVHFYMNVLTVWLTIIGFILAVVATSKESGAIHWSGKHHKVGLVIFILAVLQAAAAAARPGLPHPVVKMDATQRSQEVDASSGGEQPEETPQKSYLRVGWEYGHRIVGLGLVGLAWSNCNSGIDWLVTNFPDISDWTAAFWGVAGGISALVVLLALGLRLNKAGLAMDQEAMVVESDAAEPEVAEPKSNHSSEEIET